MLTLETAKQLKEAGWSKETEMCFYDGIGDNPETFQLGATDFATTFKPHRQIYPCPSTDELLAELRKRFGCGEVRHRFITLMKDYVSLDIDNIPEALAQLWLKLKQENLI